MSHWAGFRHKSSEISHRILNTLAAALLVSVPFFSLISPGVASAAAVGDVTITEFMADPDTISDTDGEWIELQNNTGVSIDLTGWDINDGGASTHTFGGIVAAPGERIVLCRDGNTAANGGVVCDETWSSMSLGNSGDTITLRDDIAATIDSVTYASGNVSAGHANTVSSGVIGTETVAKYHVNNFGTPDGTTLLDTTAPVFTNTRPGGSRHTRDTMETRAWVNDPESGITGVTIEVSGPDVAGPFAMVFDPTLNRWEYPINTNVLGLGNGVYDYIFVATNGEGLSSTETISGITIDNTLPTALITTMNSGDTLSGNATIAGTVNDTYANRWHVVIRDLDSDAIVVNYSSYDLSDINYVWDTTTLGYNGNFSVTLHGYDQAGNRTLGLNGINYMVVSVDNDLTPPTMSVLEPDNGEYMHKNERVFIRATDASGIAAVEMQFSGDPTWYPVSFRPNATYPDRYLQKIPDAVAEGIYDITFRATDNYGNQTTQTVTNVTVDKTNPVLNVTNPGSTLSGIVPISGTISDNVLVNHYRVQIAPGSLPPSFNSGSLIYNRRFAVGATSFSGIFDSIDTTGLADEAYHIRIVAVDRAGNNVDERLLSITVDNSVVPPVVIVPADTSGPSDQPNITFAPAPAGTAIALVGGGDGGGNVLGANTDNPDQQNQPGSSTSSTNTNNSFAGRVKAASDEKRSWLSYWYYWLPALLLLLLLIILLARRHKDDDKPA